MFYGKLVLVVGLDVAKFALQDNMCIYLTSRFKRPSDVSKRAAQAYLSNDDYNHLVGKIRLEVTLRPVTCIRSLLSANLAT